MERPEVVKSERCKDQVCEVCPHKTDDGCWYGHSEEWKTKAIFWSTQLVYTLVTVLPSYLCYHFYWWSIGT